MQCFHWSRLCNRPYDSRVGCKSCRVIEKRHKNGESVVKSPTGRWSYRQVVMAILTSSMVGNLLCMASRRTSRTSPKSLTDKPYHKQTSHKDKQISLEHVPNPSQQDWLFLGIGIFCRDPESGSISHYINPISPVMCHSFHTSKMTLTHEEQLIDHLRVFLFLLS